MRFDDQSSQNWMTCNHISTNKTTCSHVYSSIQDIFQDMTHFSSCFENCFESVVFPCLNNFQTLALTVKTTTVHAPLKTRGLYFFFFLGGCGLYQRAASIRAPLKQALICALYFFYFMKGCELYQRAAFIRVCVSIGACMPYGIS